MLCLLIIAALLASPFFMLFLSLVLRRELLSIYGQQASPLNKLPSSSMSLVLYWLFLSFKSLAAMLPLAR